ncbi:MAG TPA: hypothetical protein VKV19_17540 [Ktedonobacteraceae bacterium]|jgi:plastocyanin|nr:hypothetical protein [Ktedonobacteraceae bacterium]
MGVEIKQTREQQNSSSAPTITEKKTQTRLFSHRRLSSLGKIAFWASAVRFVAGVAGFILLTVQDSQSQDVGIAALCSLAIVLLLASKYRWAAPVSALLGAYLAYDTYTQPYVLASLADPYGSSGGFIKFIWVVIAMAISILVLAGSLGETVQRYRPETGQAQRLLPIGLSLVAGMMIGAIFVASFSRPAAPTTTTYTNGVPTVHMSDTSFDQSSVTIAKGSSLLLVDDTQVEHDLFNGSWQNGKPVVAREPGAPAVNGVIVKGNSITIGPFTTAGTYHIFCSFHPGMTLTIIVQ